MTLTIFYDSQCPLCVREMLHLQAKSRNGNIEFEDIHADDFNERWPGIDPDAASSILHAYRHDNSGTHLLYGLDVTVAAWTLVGKRHWVAWLRWPLIKSLADVCYRFFARHRYRISYLLTGQARCERCMIKANKSP